MTAPAFPIWNGENHNELGLVRRMSRSAVGGFAPLRVVEDLDDQAPARAGFNLLGQVVSVLPLHDAEQVSFAKLSRTTRDKQADPEKEKENAYWARLPRLTAPGLDIDPRKEVKGTAAGKAAATAIAPSDSPENRVGFSLTKTSSMRRPRPAAQQISSGRRASRCMEFIGDSLRPPRWERPLQRS